MTQQRPDPRLPVDAVLPQILAALEASRPVVLEAPPGAGKSTRVPLALLGRDWLRDSRIVMLEPRRLAARAVATYMARLLGEEAGGRVGYRVRRDSKVSARTQIEVVTEGILTRRIQNDPTLEDVGVLIFDEFHERGIHADTALALALQTRDLVRPDLRILVMSATLDVTQISRVLGDATIVRSAGRAYPIRIEYQGRARRVDRIESAVTDSIVRALTKNEGSILVFLPGAGEIRRVASRLAERDLPSDVRVAELYGDLSQRTQDDAIAPARDGTRKVVLATSIAETSLTIEGITVVIDSGLSRVPRFSARTGMTSLETVRASRASTEQRAGRAGRLAPGVCYRLWQEHEQHGLLAHSPPEILTADLAGLALDLATAGVSNPETLRWVDPPPRAAYAQGVELLTMLGALEGGTITSRGRAMSELPLHPRLAHMTIRATDLGQPATACDIAALLNERDFLRGAGGPPDADIALRLDAMHAIRAGLAAAEDLDIGRARRVVAEADALRRQMRVRNDDEVRDAGAVLALAYPDRVARKRDGMTGRFQLVNGRQASLSHAQPLSTAEYIVAAELEGDGSDARIFLAAQLDESFVKRELRPMIARATAPVWDPSARRVRTRTVQKLGAIVLSDEWSGPPISEVIVEVTLREVRSSGIDILAWDDGARRARERMAFMHARHPSWPSVSDLALLESLEVWLGPALANGAQLDQVDLRSALLGLLDWTQRSEMDRRAPEAYIAPTGTSAPIDYSDPIGPRVSIRLQEMFGVQENPTADGIPITIELLSPARRPVQITRDLSGFWRGSYFEVRKDLRGRYPKHVWPDDPAAAAPTRRTKPRG